MRWLSLLLLSLSLACLHGSRAAELDAVLAHSDLWNWPAADFEAAAIAHSPEELKTRPFRWVSQAFDAARAGEMELRLYGLPVVEAVMRFGSGGKPLQFTATFYARGDAGDLPKERFEALLKASIEALNKATQAKLAVRGKDATNAVKAEGLLWQTAGAQYLLEYSFTREVKTRGTPFRAEFVRLEMTPPPKTAGLLSVGPSGGKEKFTAAAHVKRDAARGDVLITGVPMVDQGQKGYCAVACAERVLRYYGLPTDANELAQVANSDAERGTNSEVMLAALKKLGARLRVRVRMVEDQNIKQVLEMMAEYNRAAKKSGKPPLPDPGAVASLNAIYAAMDVDTFRAARTKSKAEMSRFQRDVQTHVEAGIPLLWSVMLGMVPEKEIPQAAGGHMRLIIGYNLKTQEVLYTDSWGAGHELKRMPIADAWTISTGLATIEPL